MKKIGERPTVREIVPGTIVCTPLTAILAVSVRVDGVHKHVVWLRTRSQPAGGPEPMVHMKYYNTDLPFGTTAFTLCALPPSGPT
jgi:hypothetical protein